MINRVPRIAMLHALALSVATLPSVRAGAADVYRDIAFSSPGAPGDSLLLDLFMPTDPTPSAGYTIIMLHGGGYYSGTRQELDSVASSLADLGYSVVNIDYTLFTSTTPSYPQTISDALNAVHWVRTEGETINLPNRVVFFGISAGSTIAMTAAMAASTQTFARLPDPVNRGYTIDGAVGVMGRYDLVWNASVGVPQYVFGYLGVSYNAPSWMQVWNQASAISYVNATSPPTVLYHGGSDGLVPYFNSSHLQQRMIQAGAPVQYFLIPGGGHDINILGPTAAAQAQTIANSVVWIDTDPQNTPLGACCAFNGDCTLSLQAACASVWNSGGVCQPNPCPRPPPPPGACCASNGSCVLVQRENCLAIFNGSAACSPNPCPPPLGACCMPSGSCTFTPESFCAASWSINVSCQSNPCPPPLGACCVPSGECTSSSQADCAGTWTMLAPCTPNPCPQPALTGACCDPFGGCTSLSESFCVFTWTPATACQPNPCPQPPPPTGACCMGSICTLMLAVDCIGPNRRFTSPNTACNTPAASNTPCCRADFDQSSVIAVADIFAYLSAWFAGDPIASVSSTPTSPPTVQDIFDFLSAWFNGC
jgi:acetyl esterase/lipase